MPAGGSPPLLNLIDINQFPESVRPALSAARISRVEVRRSSQRVLVHLELPCRLPVPDRDAVARALREVLLSGVAVDLQLVPVVTPAPAADVEAVLLAAWPDIVLLAKARLPRLNGVLDQARLTFADDMLGVELTSATHLDLARGVDLAALLAELVYQETGNAMEVRLSAPATVDKPAAPGPAAPVADLFADTQEASPGQEPAVESDHVLEYYAQHRHLAANGSGRETPATATRPASAAVAAAPPAVAAATGGNLRGRPIPDGEARPIRDVTPDDGRVVVEGEVFTSESREIRDGKSKLLLFSISDGTDSIQCKCFRDAKEPPVEAELKPGVWVRVRGRMQVDPYSREVGLMVDDIARLHRTGRQDQAAEKRVELHLHTMYSAMDALVDPQQAIQRAVNWGHPAIAITDHGVVQAFPAASHVHVPPEFKIIYGCEAYVVDDGTPVAYRPPARLELAAAEFVAIDLETTGFSAIGDEIIELGAVRLRAGQPADSFQTFVRPGKAISPDVQELTGIRPEMVRDAPEPAEALQRFFEFCGDGILVAHNAVFDYSFLRYGGEKHLHRHLLNPVVDTLVLARSLLTHLRRYGLADLCKELGMPLESHHRADADARTAALLLLKLLELVRERHPEVRTVAELNDLTRHMNVQQLRSHHATLLVARQEGVQNLYRLISKSHLEYYNRTPRMPRSQLEAHRDGLLVGSGCAAGALFQALLRGVPEAELEELAAFYDFIELQPAANHQHLVRQGQVQSEEHLRDLNRRLLALGRKLGIPVVATGDVHMLEPQQQLVRQVLKAGIGFRDDEWDTPCYFRTTDEMLAEFAYLGAAEAQEVVARAPRALAAGIDRVQPIPDQLFAPKLEGAEERTRELAYARAVAAYGDPLPERVKARLEQELSAIIGGGYSVVYYISHLLVKRSRELGYIVGSRGSVGSSLVAWCMGITEVNALPPHQICPGCYRTDWFADGSVGSGFDLPDQDCPACGTPMRKDGQDIPFETFLGFKGEKLPDIDLNFSGEVQGKIQKFSEELLGGERQVFKAGTIGTIAEKTAYGMVRGWAEETGRTLREAEVRRLAVALTGVKRTTGQHPGGMVVVPVGMEVEAVTPVQFPADDKDSGVRTTHFDYHSFEQCLLKLDILGHDDPTTLRMLSDLTGQRLEDVPMNDPQVLALFRPGGSAALGLASGEALHDLGTVAVPEFGTEFVRRMLVETLPSQFSDLVRISGLSHGTDVWTNNAQELIRQGTCTLQSVIPTRDDIMVYLIYQGLEPATAFKIMESVRKGRGLTPEMEAAMRAQGVPQWYIDSCKRIKYMFPKAHAVAYVISSLRVAYFKVHYPKEFYAAYFTVRAATFDAELVCQGPEAINRYVAEVQAKGKEAAPKEKDSLVELEVVLEAMRRGVEFRPIDLWRSDAVRFLVEPDNALLCPFAALSGVGEAAAQAVVEAREQGPFQSVEDLRTRARLNKTVVELLQKHGCLRGLPDNNQLVFAF